MRRTTRLAVGRAPACQASGLSGGCGGIGLCTGQIAHVVSLVVSRRRAAGRWCLDRRLGSVTPCISRASSVLSARAHRRWLVARAHDPQCGGAVTAIAVSLTLDAMYRGRFVTFDDERPEVDAIGVLHGRIVALGRRRHVVRGARVTHDLAGTVSFPGFHDAHAHTVNFGLSLGGSFDLSTPPVMSLPGLYDAVAAPLRRCLPARRGRARLRPEQARRPRTLAPGARRGRPGRPVWLTHTSGHVRRQLRGARRDRGADLDGQIDGGACARDPTGSHRPARGARPGARPRLALPRPSRRSLRRSTARTASTSPRGSRVSATRASRVGGSGRAPRSSRVQLAGTRGRSRVRTTVMIAADVLASDGAPLDDAPRRRHQRGHPHRAGRRPGSASAR